MPQDDALDTCDDKDLKFAGNQDRIRRIYTE